MTFVITVVSILYLVMYFRKGNVGTGREIGMFLNLEIKFKRRFDLKNHLEPDYTKRGGSVYRAGLLQRVYWILFTLF